MKKIFKPILLVMVMTAALVGCSNDADVVSHNLSEAADNFEVQRRIVFYNGITADYILEVQGLCSIGNHDEPGRLSVTCQTGPNEYKKHFLGLSDNVTFFAEQLEGQEASAYYYRVVFKPQEIIPDVDVRTSDELPPTQN